MGKGVVIMYLIALTSPAQISQVIFSGCLRGAGDTVFVAVSSLVSIALVRPLLNVSVLLSARLRGYRRVDFARRGPIFAAFVLRRAFCGRKMDKNRSINPDKGV